MLNWNDPERMRKMSFWRNIYPGREIFKKIYDGTIGNVPINKDGIVQVVKRIEFGCPSFDFGSFINDTLLFGVYDKKIFLYDFDSRSVVYQKEKKICYDAGIVLSDNYIILYSDEPKQIILFDYINKNYSVRSYPKEYKFLDLLKINDNEVSFISVDTIYIYSINSNQFFSYKYRVQKGKFIRWQKINNESLIILILLENNNYCVCVTNHKTKKTKEYIFPKKKELIFVDVTNGLIYDENEVSSKDKDFIKIFVMNSHRYELFNYNCLFLLRQLPIDTLFEVFTIPNSNYICILYLSLLVFFDTRTNEVISFCRSSPIRTVLVSSKYIILDFLFQYKLLRNLL